MRPGTPGSSLSRLKGGLLVVALLAFCGSASGAGQFHRLSGAQVQTQLTGKVLTDGTMADTAFVAASAMSGAAQTTLDFTTPAMTGPSAADTTGSTGGASATWWVGQASDMGGPGPHQNG